LRITPAAPGGGSSVVLDIGKSGNSIVYVKMTGPQSEPVYEVITF
jgi:hypothetical protein